MYYVVDIHNNTLGSMESFDSLEDAMDQVKHLAIEKRNGKDLSDDELDNLESNFEVFDETDSDNIWCIAIGICD